MTGRPHATPESARLGSSVGNDAGRTPPRLAVPSARVLQGGAAATETRSRCTRIGEPQARDLGDEALRGGSIRTAPYALDPAGQSGTRLFEWHGGGRQ